MAEEVHPVVSLIFETNWHRLVHNIEKYAESRGLRFKRHTGHGLYYDVYRNGVKFMFDPTPEDKPRSDEPGYLVIRDSSSHYANPTRVGAVQLYEDDAFEKIDSLLGI